MAWFKQTFHVPASLESVWKFHEDPKALIDLTPPPIGVKLLHIDKPLRAGANLHFRLGVGPIGTVWHAIYDEFTPYEPGLSQCGFVDRAISGPFHSWTHSHTFKAVNEYSSTVTDDAHFELMAGPIGALISWIIGWPAVAFLFLFRRIKTRQLLKGKA
jgi:uncharacterized protein